MESKKEAGKKLTSSVGFIGKPRNKTTVMNRNVDVVLGSSTYHLKTISTTNHSVVVSWFKNNVSENEGSVWVCVVRNHQDLVLGFIKNFQVILYQLNDPQRIPVSIVNFINDKTKLQFLGYKIQQNLILELKDLGFALKFFDAIPRCHLNEQVGVLEKLISTTKKSYEEPVQGAILQEKSILISSLHLLMANF
ncbi:hypothetical protein MKW92_052584, partial [Papaver armeniacum]